MNPTTYKQIRTVMAPYVKKGIPYRKKQLKRLLAIIEDIFEHEPYLNENLSRVGRKQMMGYWRRTAHETHKTRKEKYDVLKLFFDAAQLKRKVPCPK
ncbi:hypothetical protein [Vibrio superstes]|uniref:Uncharacterized protein n=1 Tax=Vibrio superstes NBRC 103154 TaxID=1219062 RepID=A0A511QMX9_9VIBR|nr:hypothetical protein [Vibrio superstes]GEM78507.1 hypothetical protein VSU01S_07520 [Vibrio superstes NBRC 103154]